MLTFFTLFLEMVKEVRAEMKSVKKQIFDVKEEFAKGRRNGGTVSKANKEKGRHHGSTQSLTIFQPDYHFGQSNVK